MSRRAWEKRVKEGVPSLSGFLCIGRLIRSRYKHDRVSLWMYVCMGVFTRTQSTHKQKQFLLQYLTHMNEKMAQNTTMPAKIPNVAQRLSPNYGVESAWYGFSIAQFNAIQCNQLKTIEYNAIDQPTRTCAYIPRPTA